MHKCRSVNPGPMDVVLLGASMALDLTDGIGQSGSIFDMGNRETTQNRGFATFGREDEFEESPSATVYGH